MPIVPGDTGIGKARYALLATMPTVQSSTNIQAAYPATRLLDLVHPRRTTRSINTGTTRVILDFGAVTTLGTLSIETVNFQTLTSEGGNDLSSWPFIEATAVGGLVADDGRRKLDYDPVATFNYRYLRYTPSAPDAGATFYEWGIAGHWPSVTTLTQNPSTPYRKVLESKVDSLELSGGGEDVGNDSPIAIRLTFGVKLERDNGASQDEFRALGIVPRNQVILWSENEGDPTKMYHLRRKSSITITRDDTGLIPYESLVCLVVG
jgi:hypothetical protein